jgi:hypothetical protein
MPVRILAAGPPGSGALAVEVMRGFGGEDDRLALSVAPAWAGSFVVCAVVSERFETDIVDSEVGPGRARESAAARDADHGESRCLHA